MVDLILSVVPSEDGLRGCRGEGDVRPVVEVVVGLVLEGTFLTLALTETPLGGGMNDPFITGVTCMSSSLLLQAGCFSGSFSPSFKSDLLSILSPFNNHL